MNKSKKDGIFSNKEFQNILNNLDVVYFRGELKGKLLFHNTALNRILGLDPSIDLTGSPSSQFFSESELQQKYYDELEKNGFIKDFTVKINKPNGSPIYVQINSHLIRKRDDNSLLVEGTAIDITEKYLLDQNLKEVGRKFKLITDNTNDLIAILNNKFVHEFINRNAYLNVLGYNEEEIINRRPRDFAHPEDIPQISKATKRGMFKGEMIDEYRIRHKDGHYIWVESKGTFFKENGKTEGAIFISRDITEKKEAEQRLKESENKYRNLINNLYEIILEVDLKGIVTYVSPQCYEIMGYLPDEIIGKNSLDYIHPEDVLKIAEVMKEARLTNKIISIPKYKLMHKDGSVIFASAIGKYINTNGIERFTVTIRDISTQTIIKQKLKESEEKYRNLVENAQEGVWALDENENTIFVNSRICEMLGYTKNEMIDKNLHNFIPDSMEEQIEGNRIRREKGIKDTYELELLKKDGTKIYCEIKAAPIMNENLQYKGSFAYITDITARKTAEQQLKESENKYRTLFESSTDGIYSTDMEGKFIEVNEAFLKMLVYSRNELLEKNNRQITPPEWYEKEDEITFTQLSEEESKIYEKELVRKDGSIIPVNVRFWILHDDQGDPYRIWAIVRDITETKRMQQKLKEINQLKSEFLRRASHELKTPLVSIKGFADLILTKYSEDLSPKIVSNLIEIGKGCERLQAIINNLLQTSKLESPELKPKLEKEDLSFLINYCVEELHPLAVKREHSINTEIHDSIITKFEKEEIHDVISNLLTNAIKYTPPGGWIDIKTDITKDFVIVSIKDNGIGFTEEEKEKIFKQFGKIERFGQGFDLGIDGTGLGLYISKKIIESHGGEIWMESKGKNKGSRFYFSLPLLID
ncbi:MAG: PAS domain S-box protein [Promethearchaeota archaeon]